MVNGDALTQAEVDQLPDMIMVKITWSGGNGPHEYALIRSKAGVAFAVNVLNDCTIVGKIEGVGPHPKTQVWLIKEGSPS